MRSLARTSVCPTYSAKVRGRSDASIRRSSLAASPDNVSDVLIARRLTERGNGSGREGKRGGERGWQRVAATLGRGCFRRRVTAQLGRYPRRGPGDR